MTMYPGDYTDAEQAFREGMAGSDHRQSYYQSGDGAVPLTAPVAHDTPVTGASDHPLLPADLVHPPVEPLQPYVPEDPGEPPEPPEGPEYGGVT